MITRAPYRYDASAYREVFERDFTYLSGVQRNSHRFASSFALNDPATGRRWTYAQLWADAGRLADGLATHGVTAGDPIVFSLFNCPEFVLLWIAAQRLGAIATPINFRLSAGEVAHVLDDSQPAAFIYDETLLRTAAEAVARAEHQPALLAAVGAAPDGSTAPALTFEALLAAGDAHADPHPPAAATIYDETTRLYTSGTTGMPKGVSLPSIVETFSAHDVIMHFPLSPQDRTLNMTPWFHRGGLYSGGPNPGPLRRAPSRSRCAPSIPATVLDWVQELGLTFLIGAPDEPGSCSPPSRAAPRGTSSTLNGIVTMGAPLDREACLRYQQLLTPGSSTATARPRRSGTRSCGPRICPPTPARPGAPAPTTTSRWSGSTRTGSPTHPTTRPRTAQEVGEVAVRSVKSGYAYVNQPEEQAAALPRRLALHRGSGDLGRGRAT